MSPMEITGRKQKMKNSLLKASLICLVFTLLCGLYSFQTPEVVKTQRCNRTASVVYDTIITSEGEVSECIKEVVVKSDQSECKCSLYVSYGQPGRWSLNLNNYCTCTVIATIEYKIYEVDDISGEFIERTEGPKEIEIGNIEKTGLERGDVGKSLCIPLSIQAHFK